MTTGDIKNNIRTLERDLKLIKYPDPLNFQKTAQGDPTVFLPIIHYALTQYSPLVSNSIRDEGFHLLAKSDYRFIEITFNIMTNKLNRKPVISVNQFFTQGFAERKIILCTQLIRRVKSMHVTLSSQAKQQKNQTSKGALSVREPEIQDCKSQIPVKVRVERLQPILPPQPFINKENIQTNKAEESMPAPQESKINCTQKLTQPIEIGKEEKNVMYEQLFQMFGQLSNALMSTTTMVSHLQEQHENLKERHEQEKQKLNNEIILLKNRVSFLENNHRPTSILSSIQQDNKFEVQRQSAQTYQSKPAIAPQPQQTTEEFISSIKAKFENTKCFLAEIQNCRS